MIRSKLTFALIASISMISFTYMFSRVSFLCCDDYRITSKPIDNINDRQYISSSLANINCSITCSHNQTSVNSTDNQFVINSINLISEQQTEQLSHRSVAKNNNSLLVVRDDNVYREVIRIDSYLSAPIYKPPESKLLYPQDIRGITSMTIDHVCDNNYGSGLTVVVLVITRVNGFSRRDVIRRTWAKRVNKSQAKLFFAIGLTNSETDQRTVIAENHKYGDILQWNFIDNYYNLTVKSLAILRWVSMNCFNTKFIYKVDDDCLVNVDKLMQFSAYATPRTIYGYLWRKAFVDRDSKHKFFISRRDYARNAYPDYTGGPWLVPSDIVRELYETAITASLPALPYEDVYITGVVANKMRIKRALLPGLVLLHSTKELQAIDFCAFSRKIIYWQCFDDRSLQKVWSRIESSNKTDCRRLSANPNFSKIATKLKTRL